MIRVRVKVRTKLRVRVRTRVGVRIRINSMIWIRHGVKMESQAGLKFRL